MKDLRLGEVLDQVDSRSATPGGGSVAAVVGQFRFVWLECMPI